MKSASLAPSPSQLAPNTAKTLNDQESKVTNEIGRVTTPHARVPSSFSSSWTIPDGNWSGSIGRNPLACGHISIAMRNWRTVQ